MLNIVTNSVTELKSYFFVFAEFVQPYYENVADKLLLGTCFSVCGQFCNFVFFWVHIHLCDKDRQENSFPFFLLPCQVPLFMPFLMILPYIAYRYDRKKKKVCDGLLSKKKLFGAFFWKRVALCTLWVTCWLL